MVSQGVRCWRIEHTVVSPVLRLSCGMKMCSLGLRLSDGIKTFCVTKRMPYLSEKAFLLPNRVLFHFANFPNCFNRLFHRTALHFASCYGHEEIVNILVENNCEINAADNQKTTPLVKAVQMCKEVIVSLLLEHDADPNIKDANDNSALHYAVYVGKPPIAALLLSYGANIEEKTKDGFTPLLLALRENQLLVAEFLIIRGANIHVSDDRQRTTLMYAVKSDSKHIVDLLLKRDIDVFFKDSFGWNAVRYAIMGNRKVARAILDCQDSIIRHVRRSNQAYASEEFSMYRTLTESSSGITLFTPLRDRVSALIKAMSGNRAVKEEPSKALPLHGARKEEGNPENGPEEAVDPLLKT
ncbi:putative ankyrin repeat domain-containing protein 19 [Microtus ochrogaster]|uniref:Ankyrin repeat domain-containing protein 19 n=1 Tax=Microtus ochrogaster TaxID=79684 RepID=A0ABM1UA91_MICOH|nr:putative ankyrin repeat domain-containing protein 19 [Microtus ochrogaster]